MELIMLQPTALICLLGWQHNELTVLVQPFVTVKVLNSSLFLTLKALPLSDGIAETKLVLTRFYANLILSSLSLSLSLLLSVSLCLSIVIGTQKRLAVP